MALELIYTSVPRGLEPGRTGFCTVAMTRGMSPQMVKILEGLVAYTPVYEHYGPKSKYNPASIFHYPVSDGRNRYELLARVCACGLDYTKRSNKIGHFILLSEAEKANAANGPTSLLENPQPSLPVNPPINELFIKEWLSEPKYFETERQLNIQKTAPAKAEAWEQATGDAGWAAWLAESYMANPDKPCFVVFDPLQHTNLQALVAESLMLLPREKRWAVTWNTYMTAISAGLPTCNWRFCTENSAVMSAIGGCVSGAKILNLREKRGCSAGDSPLRQCARTGKDPYPEIVPRLAPMPTAPMAPPMPSGVTAGVGSSLASLMEKKRLEEQRKEELAELEKAKELSARFPKEQNLHVKKRYVDGSPESSGAFPESSGASVGRKQLFCVIGGIVALLLIVVGLGGFWYFKKYGLPEKVAKVNIEIKGAKEIANGKSEIYTWTMTDGEGELNWSLKEKTTEGEKAEDYTKYLSETKEGNGVVVKNDNPDSKPKMVILEASLSGKKLDAYEIKLVGVPTLKKIEINGQEKPIEVGKSAQYKCIGEWTDDKTRDVKPKWCLEGEDKNYASVTQDGSVTNNNTESTPKKVTLKAVLEEKYGKEIVSKNHSVLVTLAEVKEVGSIEIQTTVEINGEKKVIDNSFILPYKQSARFTCIVKDKEGNEIDTPNVEWDFLQGLTYEKNVVVSREGVVTNKNTDLKQLEVDLRAKCRDINSPTRRITLGGRKLVSIEIKGKEEGIGEMLPTGASAAYKCIAHWEGGSTSEEQAEWQLLENNFCASIDKKTGVLKNENSKEMQQAVTVKAQFEDKSESKKVTLSGKTLKNIYIETEDGDKNNTIPFGKSKKFKCKAEWTFGGDTYVNALWNYNGGDKAFCEPSKIFTVTNNNTTKDTKEITLGAEYNGEKAKPKKITLDNWQPDVTIIDMRLENLKTNFSVTIKNKIGKLHIPEKKKSKQNHDRAEQSCRDLEEKRKNLELEVLAEIKACPKTSPNITYKEYKKREKKIENWEKQYKQLDKEINEWNW